ncbi:PREDICTED: uncharacterized protein LOC104612330 isoform X2 [Nelumbo nucifera]|uniref:Uncharacterized protein LOC104612330 isoform X2 n=1 Tax=Nelumbo nucifera TaxID=4432 RepID=A0A1U8BLY8_NELNU|nr:PREDICTED: uncharacterized protein LOC104612330 isoform X2 [Nelumbo nucifera]
MDSNFALAVDPQVPHEPMDFLSRNWCNSALQVFQPVEQDQSIVHQDSLVKALENDIKSPSLNMDKSLKMDEGYLKSVPPWKSNDVKSWIWLQQAMHPELNYDRCFRKRWDYWKFMPFKNISVKKWLKEIRLKRKEEDRLQRAEVHAAISVAGVAAALAAIAAENNKQNQPSTTKEAAMASAAALVAAQCAQVAEAMGAKREQLSVVMGSAMTSTSANDILTLTAAAATSLRGAATLRGRSGLRDRINGRSPILPIEENSNIDFDFEKCRCLLAKGLELNIESSDGKCLSRSVSIILNNETKIPPVSINRTMSVVVSRLHQGYSEN